MATFHISAYYSGTLMLWLLSIVMTLLCLVYTCTNHDLHEGKLHKYRRTLAMILTLVLMASFFFGIPLLGIRE